MKWPGICEVYGSLARLWLDIGKVWPDIGKVVVRASVW